MKMPSKKKKYNARFPAGRIKKIMQSDEEIGKVAQAVPVIIYFNFNAIPRTLELFVESLLTKTVKITNSRNAKTLSPSHMKQCIMAENRFDFLRELVKNVPDICVAEDASNDSSPEATIDPSDTPYDLSMPSTSNSNETITQKAMPSNGNTSSLIRNNGVTRSCGTTIVANPQQSLKLNAGPSEESRRPFKRQWDMMSRSQKSIETSSIRSISSRSTSMECVPPKLSRSESAPAGGKITELQHHNKLSNQIQPTDLRRLKHQPKCSPSDVCIVTAPSESNNSNSSKTPQTPTAIPAPIVSTDLFNKPIVKIDYSNLALHDTSYSESPTSSSSSSSPLVVSHQKGVTCLANTQIQTTPPATVAAVTAAAAAAADSPVINIDLSNIVTSGTISASSNFAQIATQQTATATVIVPPALQTLPPAATTSKQNSYLELDEDYDDI